MEITIKRPDFQGSINGVIFDNEDVLNAAINVLNVVNEEFGELYNNGFIDCLHMTCSKVLLNSNRPNSKTLNKRLLLTLKTQTP